MRTYRLMILLGVLAQATSLPAQTNFIAHLSSPDDPSVTGVAAFSLNGLEAEFTVSFTRENIVPVTARLEGPEMEFIFDLGEPRITVHSPGPWPNGYDGSTAFFGSFMLPQIMRDDFVAGRTVLVLPGTAVGGFSGQVRKDDPTNFAPVSRGSTGLQMSFMARPPYQYQVQYLPSLGVTNAQSVTNVRALSQPLEAVVSESMTSGMGFYRLRRELCCRQE